MGKKIQPKLRQDLEAKILVEVRFSETDLMGVVHHSNYFDWFDIARLEVLNNMGIDMKKKYDFQMPVVNVQCEYLFPARFGDQLVVSAVPEETSVARYKFHFTVKNKKTRRLIAKATTVSVLNKKKGGLVLRVPVSTLEPKQ